MRRRRRGKELEREIEEFISRHDQMLAGPRSGPSKLGVVEASRPQSLGSYGKPERCRFRTIVAAQRTYLPTGQSLSTMKGDFTRSTYSKRRHHAGVVMQQGQAQFDADWNEQVDLQAGDGLVYLQVWEREVEPLEDSSLSNAGDALEPDTTARGAREGEPSLRVIRTVGEDRTSSKVEVTLGRVQPGVRPSFTLPQLEIMVGGSPWERVPSFAGCGPDDKVFVVSADDDSPTIEFGDGTQGALPAVGSAVVVNCRY